MSTNAPESVLELLRKIKALADRGIGGEAEAAKMKLDAMLKKHGLTIGDLAENSLKIYNFKYKDKTERKLLIQVCASIVKSSDFKAYCAVNKIGRKLRGLMGIKLTAAQYFDVESAFEYYKSILKIEQARFFSAFIQKHELTPPPDGSESNMSAKELMALLAMMSGLQEESYKIPLARLEMKKGGQA